MLGQFYERRRNLLFNANIHKPLVIGCIRILRRSFATFLERRNCDVVKVIVKRVDLSSDFGCELGGVHVPVDDFGIGVAKRAGGSRCLGCVKPSSVVGVEWCQC